MVNIKPEHLPESPLEKAGIFSRLFLWWLNPVFSVGAKRDLDTEDLHRALPHDQSKYLGDQLAQEWAKELEKGEQCPHKNSKNNYQPSLGLALFRQFRKDFMTFGVIAFVEECFIRVAQPMCLGYLIRYFNNTENYEKWQGYAFGAGVTLLSGLYTLTHHQYFMGTEVLAMRVKIACSSLIYRKALRLSQESIGKTNVGQLTNLMTNDLSRFEQASSFLHYLWVGPLQTALVTYILWCYYGPACFIGVGVLLAFVIFQGYCGRLISKLRQLTATRTDKRIRIMNEIVSGIRVIKMYTWEKPFAALVNDARCDEVNAINNTGRVIGVNLSLIAISCKLIVFLILVVYVMTGNSLTAEKVFVTLALYNNLSFTMACLFLKGVASVGEVTVSLRRLRSFLSLEDRNPTLLSNSNISICKNADNPAKIVDSCDGGGIVKVKKLTAKWDPKSNEPTLSNINFTVKDKSILGVVGQVGSGKSSLLHAILKELPASEGSVHVRGRIAYAPQDPWVFGGTIKENILFGNEYDSDWYTKVVSVCALQRDMKLFQFGDETLVGERGIKLSGGQKARISLARAVYSNASIYLLDDPLSAVDPKVGRHIWEDCICGLLADKTRILVTHQVHLLESTRGQELNIILLDGGKVKGQGTFAEVKQNEMSLTWMEPVEDVEPKLDTKLKKKSLFISPDDEKNVSDFHDQLNQNVKVEEIVVEGEELVPTEIRPEKVSEEDRQSGGVQPSILWKYLGAGAGYFTLTVLVLSNILAQGAHSGSDWWLSFWTNTQHENFTMTLPSQSNTFTEYYSYMVHADTHIQLSIYAGIMLALLVFNFGRTLLIFQICMNASVTLHDSMFQGIILAPMRFFEETPVGRLLNRMSRDIGSIDEQMPVAIYDSLEMIFAVVGSLVIVVMVKPVVIIPSLVILWLFCLLRGYYLKTSHSVKRLEGVARSPVFSHLSMSMNGLTTIRAFSAEDEFCKKFDEHQDMHTSSFFMLLATTRWFGVWLDWLGVLFVGVVTFSFLLYSEQSGGGSQVGLAVSSAIILAAMIQWGVRQTAEVRNHMVSVERVLEYANLTPEPPLDSMKDKAPPKDWPAAGEIAMKDLELRYGGGDPILKGITCTFRAQEKVGIVGRTGAGKTSLITTLFRLAEPTAGRIEIDGVNILEIGLGDLRSKISIIPQDPVLFSGTLRKNLDPFNAYPDEEIWNVLREIQLAQEVGQSTAGLLNEVTEGGANFSIGQRQLICLGRAMLRKNRILVMDEATANLDNETDMLIQRTIRTKFQACTVITVAHRLHTVMDSDRILVLVAGSIKEFDEPYKLLEDPSSALYSMVEQTGPATAENLREIARQSNLCRQSANVDGSENQIM